MIHNHRRLQDAPSFVWVSLISVAPRLLSSLSGRLAIFPLLDAFETSKPNFYEIAKIPPVSLICKMLIGELITHLPAVPAADVVIHGNDKRAEAERRLTSARRTADCPHHS
ncbi:unnamed protein product [Caenorhabditis auriculariae]|uniref:Uncharacterized protein n=1 Tax=Caenorhabditis auriculariae TaxID=2777116 RepID=A0A8S1GR45_9PELO|nr:unnamed protein product [Caenorhabditis auriculariae]